MSTVKPCRCAKCGYEWKPRKEPKEIRECPRCKSRSWDAGKKVRHG